MKNVLIAFLFGGLLFSCSGNSLENNAAGQGSNSNNNDGSNNSGGGSGNNSGGSGSTSGWLIPVDEVIDAGIGLDGIPSVESPVLAGANDADAAYLNDDDLVVGVVVNGEARAYPHIILDWHEIVNDQIGDTGISINYCPLTGTAFAWESFADLQFSTFGVSGLLYNTNLILYDRVTQSKWSQLKLQCVNGSLQGDTPLIIDMVELPWGIWKSMYPDTQVQTLDTGFDRNYEIYPYGAYMTNDDYFLFPVSVFNPLLPNKERVFCIIENEKSKVYQFEDFAGGRAEIDHFEGVTYLLVGDENVIRAFKLEGEQLDRIYQYDFSSGGQFFNDEHGNSYSIFGEILAGPDQGNTLNTTTSVVSYWFAIAAFYPEPQIFEN